MSALLRRQKMILNIIISLLILLVSTLNLFSFLENKLQDRAYQKPTHTNPNIVVIGIDDDTLDKFGPFQQWSRQTIADAINILNSGEEKPAVIAIDILYVEGGNDEEADYNLAAAAENGGNVVLAALANFGQDMSLNNVMKDYRRPYAPLEQYVSYGFSNSIIDSDGIIRNASLKNWYDGEIVYSFPYEIYRRYAESQSDTPIDVESEAYIAYYGEPGEYLWGVSFADIFEEDFDSEFFSDCIVLIGAYAEGFGDAYYTSISQDTLMYGVEINANIIQILIEGNFKRRTAGWVNFVILLVLIAAGMVLSEFVDIRILLGIFIAVSVGYFFVSLRLYEAGYISALIYPVFALFVIYIYQLIYGYILEAMEKQRVKSAFKKYVDPKLVDKLIESGEANSDEVGVKKNIAVLFVDVRGFTPMTEALKDQPELIVKILNEYLELTSSAVFNNGGSVDKFVGDATMALFNGFVSLDDYVFRAVKAAWEIVKGTAKVNESIKEKYGIDIGFGVGVNCGDAIVGNLGPSFRKDYTAIGDTVNTAARLESNAGRSEVLISENVYDILKDRIQVVSRGEIPLKGKNIKIEVFSVVGVSEI